MTPSLQTSRIIRGAGWALCASLAVASAVPVLAQTRAPLTAQEQEALKIVNAWDAAWNQKDVQKVASYMTEDVLFLGTRKGRAQFFEEYVKQNMSNITYEIVSEYAAGGEGQTVVVQKRIDHISRNGQQMTLSFIGYFRVKDGKIVEWQDVSVGLRLPPPPGGAPPGQAAPPGQ